MGKFYCLFLTLRSLRLERAKRTGVSEVVFFHSRLSGALLEIDNQKHFLVKGPQHIKGLNFMSLQIPCILTAVFCILFTYTMDFSLTSADGVKHAHCKTRWSEHPDR